MEKIAIAKFKATSLAVWEKVRKRGKPVLVTRFGRPVQGDFAAGRGAETSAQIPCACRYPGVLSSSKRSYAYLENRGRIANSGNRPR